jgi:hypothetical protein
LSAASIAPLLPFLGLSLGAGVGQGSTGGALAGGLGGLLLGGSAAALLAPSLFTSLLGGGALAGGTIGGALLLGRNSAKRKNEQRRDVMATTLRNELYQLIEQVRGGLDKQTALNRYQDMRDAYVEEVSHFDSKTRAHAMKWLEEDLERQVLPQLTGASAPNFLYNAASVSASVVAGTGSQGAFSAPGFAGAGSLSTLTSRLPASSAGAAVAGSSGGGGVADTEVSICTGRAFGDQDNARLRRAVCRR